VLEDVLGVCRDLWAGRAVTHEGLAGSLGGVELDPTPVQAPLEVWLGGTAPASLSRCGRVGDGWLPSSCTPDEVAAGRASIEAEAARHGRTISPEHFGVSVGYCRSGYGPGVAERLARRLEGRAPGDVVPATIADVAPLLERYLAAGASKFVLRPIEPVVDWERELAELAEAVLHLQR
jgi:alkanesulfonate monooxygenase SsuD/methylene tetrahydromethanopterin reductase-like flavin-dependent oxidoreductase (luciferase family)